MEDEYLEQGPHVQLKNWFGTIKLHFQYCIHSITKLNREAIEMKITDVQEQF